jgi:hypothetical protein
MGRAIEEAELPADAEATLRAFFGAVAEMLINRA